MLAVGVPTTNGEVLVDSGGIDVPAHDYESYTYTDGRVTTITYKRGGSGGTTVGTMTIAYDGNGNPTSRTVVLV